MKLNKKQKRTATIASMAALLAVVLGMGGQTFAKYITTERVETQSAIVAKWGVVAKIDATGLFGKEYEKNIIKDGGADIVASGSTNVIAPGSSGSVSMLLTGDPEVSTNVVVEATGTDVVLQYGIYENGASIATKYEYYPIVWTLYDNTAKQNVLVTGTEANGEIVRLGDIIEKINSVSGDYEANEFEDAVFDYTLSWAWDFDDNGAGTNDNKDTALGNIIAGVDDEYIDPNKSDKEEYYTSGTLTSLSFSISMTVTQTQTA